MKQQRGRHLFTSSDEDSEEDVPERSYLSNPWLLAIHPSLRSHVWGGYIDNSATMDPLPQVIV